MPGRGQKELFERLIREVKKRECLYNIWHPSYKDRHTTEGEWEAVALALGMTVMDVKRLWGTLRSSFTRSVKTSLCATVGPPAQKRTPWYLEDEMLFLRPHLNLVMPGGKRLSHSPSLPHMASAYGSPNVKSEFPYSPPLLFGTQGKTDQIQIKRELNSPPVSGEKRDLEEGEILPEDLIPGNYWITPQFPDRIGKQDLNPCSLECSSSSPQCSDRKCDYELTPNMSQASLMNMNSHMFQERLSKPDFSTNVNIPQSYANTQQDLPDMQMKPGFDLDDMNSSVHYSKKKRLNFKSEDSKKDSDCLTKKLRPEDLIGDRSSKYTASHTSFQSILSKDFHTEIKDTTMNIKDAAAGPIQEDADTDFFKGIMPRFKELNRKNKRRFEVQALQLLYSILDDQEVEEMNSS